MGIKLEQWTNGGCVANFGVGEDWATLYDIESKNEGRGEATNLLIKAKKYYEKLGKKFGGSVALNDRMKNIYKRLKITEYDDDYMARIWQEKKLIKIEIIEQLIVDEILICHKENTPTSRLTSLLMSIKKLK